ncbi:ATP-grasp fold amidoligase family protein [uncultured Pseudokineococcus sp.]|uniref:ATP-grasp fold amidoligase family protein n=1 Tax=uncultured Pseudokineococcus sp. TaxID=1642928 RepID=UPI00260ABCAC|nr:ATP-grasp fold amidoligase family protein [uncultured Pseudokineococcus sp.]
MRASKLLPAPLRRRVFDVLPVEARRALLYQRAYGSFPRVRLPRTFSEKLNWRVLRDRRPQLVEACDKLASKEVATAAGVEPARTLWSGTDLAELASVDLGERWVLKPNHRSGGIVHFGSGRADPDALAPVVRGWLDVGAEELRRGEWAYGRVRRLLVAEERLGTPGEDLVDLKVHVFDGEPVLVQTHHDRFEDHRVHYYRPDWTPVAVNLHSVGEADLVPPPEHLDEVLEAASRLGAGWDYARVDLYDEPEGVRFGELTVYPGSGITDFRQDAWLDRELGERWTLPRAAVAASTAARRHG